MELKELKQNKAKNNFRYFFEEILEYEKKLSGTAHEDIIALLQRIKSSIENKEGLEELLMLPRGTWKSTVFTIAGVNWLLTLFPNLRILISNASLGNAEKFLDEIKRNFKKQSYIDVFGDVEGEMWRTSEIRLKTCARSGKEMSIVIGSPTTSLVSQHFDIQILDDLVNRESVNTMDQMERTKQYWLDLIPLGQSTKTIRIGIGTKWHYADLYSWLLERGIKAIIKTIYRDEAKTESFFPEEFSIESIEKLKKDMGTYDFCTPAETPILMANWKIKRIDEVKVGDKIIGFEIGSEKNRSKLKITEVLSIKKSISPVIEWQMESGRYAASTLNHKWYTGRTETKNDSHKSYLPAKIGRDLWLMNRNARFIKNKDKIIGSKFRGVENVYSLMTDTGNYIAWGYASSNSMHYMNSPIDDANAVFKASWMNKRYKWADLEHKRLVSFAMMDFAESTEEGSDFTGIVVIAVDELFNWYILLAKQERLNITQKLEKIFDIWLAYKDKNLISIGVEKKAFNDTIKPLLKIQAEIKGIFPNVLELKDGGVSKDNRIRKTKGLVPRMEYGKIYFRHPDEINDDTNILIDQCLRFPKNVHDDLIDALAYGDDIVYAPFGEEEKVILTEDEERFYKKRAKNWNLNFTNY